LERIRVLEEKLQGALKQIDALTRKNDTGGSTTTSDRKKGI
jgi:hypothetical protein